LVDKFLKEDKYEMAVKELEKILMISPDETKAKDLLRSTTKAIVDNEVKVHYEKADAFMKQKRYDLAIEEWREILKVDKEQEAASRLIAATIRSTFLGSAYNKAEKLFTEGDYTASLEQYNRISIDNPTDQYVRKIITRLNDVLKLTPRAEKQGQSWDMVRKSLTNYISPDGNQRVALAASWYAVQLDPDNTIALAVRDFLEHELITVVRTMEYPTRDMNIIDQYLFAALNNIYGGRYDIAIQETGLVLELQPRNILALKRLGSAYFAMKNKDKAREVWEKALKIAPDDAELKKFINQAR
ncbi:MAG: tetratricopeptide repeat protein, partial [Nitrospirae bacterium]|nr:tetratricopeptide repeat protein [Nitrospirota bacterium]